MRCATPRHDARRGGGALLSAAMLAAASGATRAQTWPAFAGSPARVSIAPAAPGSIDVPRWILSTTDSGAPITLAGQAGVVASASRVYAVGSIGGGGSWYLICASGTT